MADGHSKVDTLSYLNLAATLVLTGLIFTIQLVHYPSFFYIDRNHFIEFERFHQQRMTILVAPLMLLELATSSLLFALERSPKTAFEFALVVLVWIVTFFWSVPKHSILAKGYNEAALTSLIRSNLLRTILWTARAATLIASAI